MTTAPNLVQDKPPSSIHDAEYERLRAHVISRIEQAPTGKQPFYHTFIEQIFPPDFYDKIRAHMLSFKHSDKVQDRHQDNAAFMNKRYNLFKQTDDVTDRVRALFSDPDVKMALLKKFYITPSMELADALAIHEEFEYFFTKGGRFQNIHVDIPPKFMSFVFYIPENPVAPAEEERNATVLYDKALEPHYPARFKANSVCVFVPHFYTYHGFASTIDRDVMVIFYVNKEFLASWKQLRKETKEEPPFTGLLDAIEQKIRKYPLLEYGTDEKTLQAERSACRVNAPQGRVMKEPVGK